MTFPHKPSRRPDDMPTCPPEPWRRRIRKGLRLASLIVATIVLASCAAREPFPRFFVLTPTSDSMSGHAGGTSVFVRRVEVPAYLVRLSLVTMRGGSEADYAETARWAEPLDQGVARAVAANLNRRSGITAFGFSPAAPPGLHRYDVQIRLERFEGTDSGDVVLAAHWQLSTADGSSVTSRRTEIHRSGWVPGDYPGLVRLLSDAVAEMSGQIARAIR
jgi:uncharacterized protein